MKEASRWLCWDENKAPIDAKTGKYAKVNDPSTWADFDSAVGYFALNDDVRGVGFVLGDGFAGIDLDNHPDENTGEYPMSDTDFRIWADEVITRIDSYAEWSPSGKGIHIFYKGKLPEGRRRNDKIHDIEMYDDRRFLTVTGNKLYGDEVEDREEEANKFWKEFVADEEPINVVEFVPSGTTTLNDRRLVEVASKAKNGAKFQALYNGDTGGYGSHSQADMALCSLLAFYTQCDRNQMDSIFRSSGLMRDKWDEMRGDETYGNMTIDAAIKNCKTTYAPQNQAQKVLFTGGDKLILNSVDPATGVMMNIDENQNIPVPHADEKYLPNWNKYGDYTDYDNAKFFNDTYGGIFKYNNDDKKFMFWTGKTWSEDKLQIVAQYMNDFGKKLRGQYFKNLRDARDLETNGQDEEADSLREKNKYFKDKCIGRFLNNTGRNAIIATLQTVEGVGAKWDMFDKEEYLLNTDSGIVDIRDGTIYDFDKSYMQSRSTHCKVSFEEPTKWIEFVNSIFYRGDSDQAKEQQRLLVEFIQILFGLCCLGERREQFLFILYGGGSNGKSTMIDQIAMCLGDYFDVMDSSVLMSRTTPVAAQNAMAEEVGVRCLSLSETSAGNRLDMSIVKRITGDAKVSAQKKYGDIFSFEPKFNPIMMTNNLPIISEVDYATWRRIVPIPFTRKFTNDEKNVDLPIELCAETDKILGWCIKGYQRYMALGGNLEMLIPQVIAEERNGYQKDMNNISVFVDSKCRVGNDCQIKYDILQRNYNKWATEMGYYKMPSQQFDKYFIESRGFRKVNSDAGLIWKGVTLRDPEDRDMLFRNDSDYLF